MVYRDFYNDISSQKNIKKPNQKKKYVSTQIFTTNEKKNLLSTKKR